MPIRKDNQRKHARASLCRLVKVQLSRASTEREITHLSDVSESGMRFHITDLSTSGFRLSSPGMEPSSKEGKTLFDMKKGDTLFFRMRIDPAHDDIAVLGSLAWVTRKKGADGSIRVKAGVHFLDISDRDKQLIQIYVSAFQQES